MRVQRLRPGAAVEIHLLRRHRLVGRRAERLGLARIAPRRVVLADQLEALADRFVRHVVERHRCARQIVEQRIETVVEQRQPVFLARIATPRADRLVERIVTLGAAEQFDVAAAEHGDRFLAVGDLRNGQQHQLLHDLLRALALDVERLDALQRIAEEIEAHRRGPSRREEIENAAAHRELARLHDRAGALIADLLQTLRQPLHVDALAGRDLLHGLADEARRRHPLQDRIHRRQHDGRLFSRRDDELGQRRHAFRDDVGVGADAIVRHRVPRREGDHPHIRCEERELLAHRLHAAVVARDMDERVGALADTRLAHQIGEHQRVEPFRHARQQQIVAAFARHDGSFLSIMTGVALFEAVEHAQVTHQPGELAPLGQLRREDPLLQLDVGDLEEPLEAVERGALHGFEPRVGIAPDQPVHLLGAAVGSPIGGAAAAGIELAYGFWAHGLLAHWTASEGC
jgi:hypothetical protein